jgi:hypothetical protein
MLHAAGAGRLAAAQGLAPFDVTEKSVRDLQTAMDAGRSGSRPSRCSISSAST